MRRLVFDQSSQVHPVSESRVGGLRVTEKSGRRADGQRVDGLKTEILVSNIECKGKSLLICQSVTNNCLLDEYEYEYYLQKTYSKNTNVHFILDILCDKYE